MAIASLRRQAMAPPCGVLKRTLGYKRHGRAKALFAYKLGRGAREQLTGLKFTYPQFGPLWRHTRKVPDFTSPCASTQILCPPTLTKTGEQRRPQTVYLLTNLCPPQARREALIRQTRGHWRAIENGVYAILGTRPSGPGAQPSAGLRKPSDLDPARAGEKERIQPATGRAGATTQAAASGSKATTGSEFPAASAKRGGRCLRVASSAQRAGSIRTDGGVKRALSSVKTRVYGRRV